MCVTPAWTAGSQPAAQRIELLVCMNQKNPAPAGFFLMGSTRLYEGVKAPMAP